MTLEVERERAIQALCAHYAQDQLSTQELEARFERVYRASTESELRATLIGLPALRADLVVAEGARPELYQVSAEAAALPEKRILAVMSELKRQGPWLAPPRITLRVVMGTVRLDLREAQLPPGGVDIDVLVVMGEAVILLPPGVRSDVDGTAVMGEWTDRTHPHLDPADPMIRIHGSAIMGTVRAETRLPRESDMEAFKKKLKETLRRLPG